MKQEEARRGWGEEGGDVGAGEMIYSSEIPKVVYSSNGSCIFAGLLLLTLCYVHLVVRPLNVVHQVQAAVDDVGVHLSRLLAEARDAIAALL